MDTENNKGLSIIKIIAAILFISLPFLGFYIGINYEKSTNNDINEVSEIPLRNINNNNSQILPTQTIPSPVVSKTANWKTYISKGTGYGFLFQYPEDLEIQRLDSISPISIGAKGKIRTISISMPIVNDNYLSKIKSAFTSNEEFTVTKKKINHPKYNITEFTFKFKKGVIAGTSNITVFVEYGNAISKLSLVDISLKDTFYQILSTYKFDESDVNKSLDQIISERVASGICLEYPDNDLVTITINEDTPYPKCTKVSKNQKLKIINNMNRKIAVSIGEYTMEIDIKNKQTLGVTFGSYLKPGINTLNISPSFTAEIWLKE